MKFFPLSIPSRIGNVLGKCLLGLGDGFVLNILVGYRTTSRAHPAVHLPVFGSFVSLAYA